MATHVCLVWRAHKKNNHFIFPRSPISLQIWDFPGQIDFFDPAFDSEHIFGGCGALIFVIDAQVSSHRPLLSDLLHPNHRVCVCVCVCGCVWCCHGDVTQDDYREALIRLHQTVTRAYQVNQSIKFEVFIHKVDGLSDDRKIEAQRDIHQRATDELADVGLEGIHLSFYLTSIYDHTIFEVKCHLAELKGKKGMDKKLCLWCVCMCGVLQSLPPSHCHFFPLSRLSAE